MGALTRSCYGYMPPRQRPHLGQHSKNVPLSLGELFAAGYVSLVPVLTYILNLVIAVVLCGLVCVLAGVCV